MTNEEFNARMDRITLTVESLVERHQALTQSMELFQREMVDLKKAQAALTETARLLLKVAESHQYRLGRLENEQS